MPQGDGAGGTVGAPGPFDLKWVLNALLSAVNPVIVGIYDAAGNRMPSMDVAARAGFVDPIDRWARQLGMVDLQRYLGVACGPANPIDVEEVSPTAVIEGQVTLTGAAQNLPNEPCKSVTLENPSTNAVVAVGHDNTVTLLNGYRLRPGATWSLDIDNTNRIWVIGTAPQVISYGGVN